MSNFGMLLPIKHHKEKGKGLSSSLPIIWILFYFLQLYVHHFVRGTLLLVTFVQENIKWQSMH